MKVWRNHTFARRHRRAYTLSVYVDSTAILLSLGLGRHNWALEVER